LGQLEKNTRSLIDTLINYEGEKIIYTKAITHYSVLDSNNRYSLLKLNPETGRKHQIRKQLLMHGCPIIGDVKYRFTDKPLRNKNSLMLHAYKINFSIGQKKYNFKAEPSENFKKIVKEKYLRIF
jgi:Pseudouridylate synthases, 23S RNA-specific